MSPFFCLKNFQDADAFSFQCEAHHSFCTILTFAEVECGGVLEERKGDIKSPFFGRMPSYPNNFTCSWTIMNQPNKVIVLDILDFDVRNFSDSKSAIFNN